MTLEELKERRQFIRDEKDKILAEYEPQILLIKQYYDIYTEALRIVFDLKEDYTYIFEVIDNINDPHIIKYPRQEIVLLDIVQNTLVEDNFLPYIEVEQEARRLGVRVKSYEYVFENWNDLYKCRQERKNDWSVRHEGWVITDGKYRVKMKSAFYTFWKDMRKNLERLQGGSEIKKVYKTREEIQAIKLMQAIPREELKKMNIIDIEDRFYS